MYKCLRGLPQIYNCHVQRLPAKRSLPKETEDCKADTHCETRKKNSDEISKFRPISLHNTGGKVLEKLPINRISHHVFAHDIMNKIQCGFTPPKITTDAAMAVKRFVEEGLAAG